MEWRIVRSLLISLAMVAMVGVISVILQRGITIVTAPVLVAALLFASRIAISLIRTHTP